MPTLQEVKDYLGVDGEFSDSLIQTQIEAARELVEGILRYQIAKVNPTPSLIKEAIKFAVAFLFSNREGADIASLTRTLRTMLSSLRKEAF